MVRERINRKQQRLMVQASWIIWPSPYSNKGLRYLHAKAEMMKSKQEGDLALLHQPEAPEFKTVAEGKRRGHTGRRLLDFVQGCNRDHKGKYGQGRRYRAALAKQKEATK